MRGVFYKVITGDENNASEMGRFTGYFDKIAKIGKCAVAFSHHHSKGSQAGKNAIDRSSGSGVFARDPDAIVDLTELDLAAEDRNELRARLVEAVCDKWLEQIDISENLQDKTDRIAKQELMEIWLAEHDGREKYEDEIKQAESIADSQAYRVSMILREFKSPDDFEVLFKFPIHVKDPTGYLKKMYLKGDTSIPTLNKKKKEKKEKRDDQKREWYDQQRKAGKMVTQKAMMEKFRCARNTLKKWIDEQGEDHPRSCGEFKSS